MSKPVRFRFESLSAERAHVAQTAAFISALDGPSPVKRARRAARLILHWWARGHHPARHVLACWVCAGTGDGGCDRCSGTGRISRTDSEPR